MKGSSLLGRLTTQGVTDPEGIWGVDKTAPGRGGGPGACLSEALGGIRTRRGNGTGSKRAWRPLRFWNRKMGAQPPFQKCESRMRSRQKRICREWNYWLFVLSGVTLCRSPRIGCMAGLRKRVKERMRKRILQWLVLRVPLDADDKARTGQANRLDLPVRCHRLDDELWRRLVDPLAVQRIDHDRGGPGQPREQCARGHRHGVHRARALLVR